MSRQVHTWACLVDAFREPGLKRNTAGVYLVGARDPKLARRALKQAIGFGSVQVYYRATGDDGNPRPEHAGTPVLANGQCLKKMPDGTWGPVRHASEPIDAGTP